MTDKKICLRPLAEDDIDKIIDYYRAESSIKIASRFADSIEAALRKIAAYPAIGSPRYSALLNIPDLRAWPIKGFSYLIFYIDQTSQVDIWRILHKRRDIPEVLQEPNDT